MIRRAVIATSVAVAATLPAPALSQAVAGGALFQSYTFTQAEVIGLRDFTLLTAPFAVSIPVTGFLSLQASGAFAEGEASGPEGAKATLSGLTDTEVGIAVALGEDRAVLTAGASLPTGQSTQTLEEAAVAGVVAAELLPFAVTNWGSGGGAGGDLAVAFQGGGWGVGISGGYRAAAEYEPIAGQTFAYRPGNQLRFRLALDRDVGESETFSVLVGLQRFSEDQIGGNNLFRSGNRLEGVVSYAFAVGLQSSALLYSGVYHRARGSLLLEESSLEGAHDSPSQQLFMGGANLRIPAGRRAILLPDIDVRIFRSEDGVGQGWITTAGASLDIHLAGRRLGRHLVLAPTARYRYGHVVVREGSESDLTGWEAGVTLRVETGR
jgi:hypothetical protein